MIRNLKEKSAIQTLRKVTDPSKVGGLATTHFLDLLYSDFRIGDGGEQSAAPGEMLRSRPKSKAPEWLRL